MKKPDTITYAVDDRPPLVVTVLSGLQHVGIIAIVLVFPLLLGREAGLSADQTSDILGTTMLVLGIGAALQSLPRGGIGAGYLCPPSARPPISARRSSRRRRAGYPSRSG